MHWRELSHISKCGIDLIPVKQSWVNKQNCLEMEHLGTSKINLEGISISMATNEAFKVIDASRASTEKIAPFIKYRSADIAFIRY